MPRCPRPCRFFEQGCKYGAHCDYTHPQAPLRRSRSPRRRGASRSPPRRRSAYSRSPPRRRSAYSRSPPRRPSPVFNIRLNRRSAERQAPGQAELYEKLRRNHSAPAATATQASQAAGREAASPAPSEAASQGSGEAGGQGAQAGSQAVSQAVSQGSGEATSQGAQVARAPGEATPQAPSEAASEAASEAVSQAPSAPGEASVGVGEASQAPDLSSLFGTELKPSLATTSLNWLLSTSTELQQQRAWLVQMAHQFALLVQRVEALEEQE